MRRPAEPSANERLKAKLLLRLGEVTGDGITVAALHDEFGAATRRCLTRLAFDQLIEVFNVVFGAVGFDIPEDEPELDDWKWRSPHPLLQRHALPVIAEPKTRVRLSPFGQLVLAQKSISGMASGESDSAETRQRLGELLTAIVTAALRLDPFFRILRDSPEEPEQRRVRAGRCLRHMTRIWHRGMLAFRASIDAHIRRASLELKYADRLTLSQLLKIMSKLETHRPERPLDEFEGFVEAVRVRSSSLALDLISIIPDTRNTKKARRRAPRPSKGQQEAEAEMLLAKNRNLSTRKIGAAVGVSHTVVGNLKAWKRNRDELDALGDGARRVKRPRDTRRPR